MKLIALSCLALAAASAVSAAGSVEPVLVVNRGIGGNSSKGGLARFERDVIESNPDHVILYFGINDAGNSRKLVPLDAFKGNMQTMVDRCRAAGVKTVVLVTPNPIIAELWGQRHPTHPHKDSIHEYLAQFGAAVRELAKENGLPVADLHKLVMDHGGAREFHGCLIRNLKNTKSRDGVHLTERGYRLMAELFEPIFLGKVKPGEVVVCMGDSITYGAHVEGQGTSFGKTYPAWLWLVLNRMIGATDRELPLDPPRRDPAVLLDNGGFERSDDRVHADGWRLWNVPGRQAGKEMHVRGEDAHEGKSYLLIDNPNPKAPACLNATSRTRIKSGAQYALKLWVRGKGTVKPQLLLFAKRKYLSLFPPSVKQPTIEATSEWAEHALLLDATDGVAGVLPRLRIAGQVALDGVALQLVASPKTQPALPMKGEGLRLRNERLSLLLYPPEQGGGVRGITNARGFEFVNGACSGALWRIEMRRIPKPGEKHSPMVPVTLDPEQDDGALRKADPKATLVFSSNSVNASTNVEHRTDGLRLSWSNIQVGREKDALDVVVAVTLAKGDRFARFRTEIRNRSKQYTVFYATSPQVDGVYPPDGKTGLDRLASPVFNGRLIHDPISNGILGKPYRFQPNRSGHSMQFDAYCHDGKGLYLGCFDGEQHAKRYYLAADAQAGFTWGMVHVPNNMKAVPQEWTTPYDTVIGCFDGDWYDACRIYREWALKQPWAKEGPLHQRASTPKWFKELDDWFQYAVTQRPFHLEYDPLILKTLKGLKLGVIAHHWGKGSYACEFTPDRFPLGPGDVEYIQKAKEYGFSTIAYIQGICWDVASESFKAHNGPDHTVRNFHDQRLVWKLGRGKKRLDCAIAYPGKVWTEVLGDTIERMAEAGFDVAYLDSFNHAGTYLNFNPLYAKGSCGGGNQYIKDNQRLADELRRRARKHSPGFCFTSESFWEGNLAHVDGYLVCNTTNQPLARGQVEAIPMIHAVYHDYAIFYSNWNSKWDLEEEGARGYLAKYAQTFVWGVKSAWTQPKHMLPGYYRNHEIALEAAERRGRAYAAAKQWLVYGEMLRAPKPTKPIKQLDVKWFRAWSSSYYDIPMPAVMHTLWRAPDGAVALVLYNIDDTAHTLTLRLADPAYGLPRAAALAPRLVYPSTGQAVSACQDAENGIEVTLSVPPRSPKVVELHRR